MEELRKEYKKILDEIEITNGKIASTNSLGETNELWIKQEQLEIKLSELEDAMAKYIVKRK